MPPQKIVSSDDTAIASAILADLPQLIQLLMELFEMEGDFEPNSKKQEEGLKLILEHPHRGRVLVIKNESKIIGMVNMLFTISTAEGGLVLLLEDFIIHPMNRGQGYGKKLLTAVKEFAQQKDFKRITLLTDKISAESQDFFNKEGFQFSKMIPMRLHLD
ncbi:MAG: GNAT family N-acetyltransferase [Akkermansiaceae bacterium]|jgi:N-acetylglutamate synthase-like GNAT family acetyltransferase|nr:GNAT family N-acetyltransferase [Akkermansiaceae bacterium]